MSADQDPSARPYARGRGRESEILRAAASAFSRGGFQRTTVAVIAAEAGMTQAGILYHHSSKAHLYRSVVKKRVAPEALAQMQGPPHLSDMVERIIQYVRWVGGQPEVLRFRAVFSGEALIEENPATDILVAEHLASLRILEERLTDARDSGEIRADVDVRLSALELMAVNEGLRHLAVAHTGLFEYGDVFEQSIRRWYRDLLPAEG
jgi:AcrR family transcriptional regulator